MAFQCTKTLSSDITEDSTILSELGLHLQHVTNKHIKHPCWWKCMSATSDFIFPIRGMTDISVSQSRPNVVFAFIQSQKRKKGGCWEERHPLQTLSFSQNKLVVQIIYLPKVTFIILFSLLTAPVVSICFPVAGFMTTTMSTKACVRCRET